MGPPKPKPKKAKIPPIAGYKAEPISGDLKHFYENVMNLGHATIHFEDGTVLQGVASIAPVNNCIAAALDTFDRLTAIGWKLDLVRGVYIKPGETPLNRYQERVL